MRIIRLPRYGLAMTRTYVITGAGSGIGAATAEVLMERGHRVIGVDLKNAQIESDLSTPNGRANAAEKAIEAAGGTVDAVIAAAGIARPVPLTVAVNFFGVTEFLEAMLPALAKSASPRAAVVSSMATLQPVADDLVDMMLAGDEPKALELGEALAGQGEQVGY